MSGLSTINVTYGYDAAGNRTSMNHSIGGAAKDSATYNYDQLSRMTSETRHINALEGYGPNGNGDYTIGYGYTVSSELQSVTDPFSSTTNLSYDVAGRTSTVSGSYGGTNYTYASSVAYRAWDAVKSASFSDNDSETVSYNTRLQPTQFRLTNGANNVARYDYNYFNDGRLKQLMDLDDQMQTRPFHYMARVYSYDHAGRVTNVSSAPNHGSIAAPFTGNYGYDAFNNMTSRSGQYALNSNESDSGTYSNNKRSGWNYNVDGRVTTSSDNSDAGGSSTRTWTYNVAGQEVTVSEVRNGQTTTNNLAYDGDGGLLYESVSGGATDYLIRSTVLGTVLTKLDATGNKDTTYVPANGLVMPLQQKDYNGNPTMSWVHRDALGLQENGQAYDPFGNLIYNVDPPYIGPPPYQPFYGATYGGASWNSFINANNFGVGCKLDGVSAPCSSVFRAISSGQVGSVTLSTTGGPADFANLGIFVTISPAQPSQSRPPTLKPSMPRNPQPGNRDPYGIGADEGLQYLINITFSSDLLDGNPRATVQPQGARVAPTPNPCGVAIPTDPNNRAVLATLLGEASGPGENTWSSDQSGVAAYNHPSGTLTEENVYDEMLQMVAVIDHRLQDWGQNEGYQNWQDVVQAPGQFLGYGNGQNILQNLGPDGSFNCTRARLGVAAIKAFHDSPWTSRFYYWKGIKQRNSRGQMFIRALNGAWRWGNTDFQVRQ